MTPKQIGATVKAVRIELGLTTAELGKKAGISQGHVSRLENGRQGFRSGSPVKLAKTLARPATRANTPSTSGSVSTA